ncbi:M15 family metallopeptidase [Aquibacillus sp. 3ASR75-11]|uniref:M15 family metallopeptidase n=1 Tax=Terrihalobacillus insolitus TaxID=2950438 RepID=A0A9X4ANM7_9BACI|nr:M15 family metallopeptidase [Terrihalobacillus insolitus]MDC3413555.1 M15 family metallopeptidase [Terrihalobacillus insolitus]MDC3424688.1 M15 family metallopeptidase [Terrihalobacillus insolitus]
MKRSYILLLLLSLFVLLVACQQSSTNNANQEDNKNKEDETESKVDSNDPTEDSNDSKEAEQDKKDNTEQREDQNKDVQEETTEDGMVVVNTPNSLEVVVNKQRTLPEGFTPKNLMVPNVPFSFDEDNPKKQLRQEAAKALEALFAGAEQDGVDLVAASGFRSYQRQKEIYNYNVQTRGKEEADKFSARPGTSEHQTGLAMDVTSAEAAFALEQTFKQTKAGSWLSENAYRFGFVIRYPEGKSEITGYSYEPWHIRYVGDKTIAKEMYNQNLTLEEYFDLIP